MKKLTASASDEANIRYRISMYVDDNGVELTGSSVWHFSIKLNFDRLTYTPAFRGEAVYLTTLSGRPIFALPLVELEDGSFGSSSIRMLPERLFADDARDAVGEAAPRHVYVAAIGRMVGKSCDIPFSSLRHGVGARRPPTPFLVTFADIEEPGSVEALDPHNLASSLGDGISLKRISIEITRDDPTERVKHIFPWFEEYRSKYLKLDGVWHQISRPYDDPIEARLGTESFSMGFWYPGVDDRPLSICDRRGSGRQPRLDSRAVSGGSVAPPDQD